MATEFGNCPAFFPPAIDWSEQIPCNANGGFDRELLRRQPCGRFAGIRMIEAAIDLVP